MIWKVPLSGGEPVRVTTTSGLASFETADGDIYFNEEWDGPSRLWRQPAGGGRAIQVLEGLVFGNFAMLDRGIYYMDRRGDPRLQYFDLGTHQITSVASNLGSVGPGLTASPDGRTILFSRTDSSVDDLMLVENFR